MANFSKQLTRDSREVRTMNKGDAIIISKNDLVTHFYDLNKEIIELLEIKFFKNQKTVQMKNSILEEDVLFFK